ncbi:MAG: alcohol dehydrogenase [Sphingomonadales bacterium]|nr:MAG: alcohol dehydrogenase [Sphingomonadales bacterium]TNF04531.1 MAG: alcohol dehydrogenase [Sphingomonadales bacterium]
MHSAIFHGPGKPLILEDRPIPEPGAGQVLIKVGRCGICGSDVKMTDERSPVHFASGCTPGHEYAGEIAALGQGVSGLKVGDRVTALPVGGCGRCPSCLAGDPYACTACSYLMGGFAEYTLAQAAFVTRLPASLSLDDGALVEPLACGSQAMRLSGATPQSRILIMGAGPMGLAALYWARQMGCRSVALCATSRRNADRAMNMGATAFLEADDDLADRVTEALGAPADIVFECTGSVGAISRSVDLVSARGTVVSSGMCFDAEPFTAGPATMKQVRLQFSMAYVLSDFHRAIDAFDAGHVEPRAMVSEQIALSALPAKLESLRSRHAGCKIMVKPD